MRRKSKRGKRCADRIVVAGVCRQRELDKYGRHGHIKEMLTDFPAPNMRHTK